MGVERAAAGSAGRAAPAHHLRPLLDLLDRVPALVPGRRMDVVAWNAAADAVFDLFGTHDFNALRLGGRLVSIAAPPGKRTHYETGYVFVRPSGYDLGEHITPLVA